MFDDNKEIYNLAFFERNFPQVIDSLRNVKKNKRLSHAYIIYSDNSELRKSFAFVLAQIILCSEHNSAMVPCLKCSSCLKIMEGVYPDIYTLEPISKSRQIVIGQDIEDADTIRWFQARFSLSSMSGGGGKIGIVNDADRITVQAQNAFLKTLEEPPKGSYFMLTSGNPHTLLPTVISRCQFISLITNRCTYEFSCCNELYDLLNSMILTKNNSFSFAVEASDILLKMFDSLRKEAEESTKEKWAKRLVELEHLDSMPARKRITTKYDAAAVAEYRLLREYFLSAVHSWFAQVFQLVSGIDPSFLANPEIVKNYIESDFRLSYDNANRMLGQVEKLIKNLKWNINEQLAVQEFCINLVVQKNSNIKKGYLENMVKLNELTGYLNNFLGLDQIARDPSNNGLQIEGSKEVKKIIFGVDSSVKLMQQAVDKNADFIFVHHGLSWGSSLKYLTKYNARLVKDLFKHDISFYAVHLPLDAHPVIGHNAQMAEMLQLEKSSMFAKYCDVEIGFTGMLHSSMTVNELASHFNDLLTSKISKYSNSKVEEEACFIIDNGKKVKKVGIISGGSGMDGVLASFRENVDCLITGEFSHQCYHLAQENGLSVIAAGHYRTETPGIFGMMGLLEKKYGVETEFIHIPTKL